MATKMSIRTETPASQGSDTPLLAVDGLRVEFRTRNRTARAVNGVSFSVDAGETLAILGESGCGKSVTAQAVLGILDSPPGFVVAGEIRYRGVDLMTLTEAQRRQIRGNKIAMIFQDAQSALNPVFTVGFQLAELFRKRRGLSRAESRKRATDLLELVRIPAAKQRINDFPHQFSGGMRQRVMIAMALALDPEVLIADEPTTAVDVTVQAQIMRLLTDLQVERKMGLILITHDMGVVADVAGRIAVMYAGRIVEQAPVHDIYATPAHPYTKALLQSIPRPDQKGHELSVIKGLPPSLTDIPPGCAFGPRCQFAQPACRADPAPQLYLIDPQHTSACHFWQEVRDA